MSTSTTSVVGDDRDHLVHETILLSTKQIVASIEASSAGIKALLCKIVDSQAQNQQQQAQNQLQMMEMLKILANNNNSRNTTASISNEESAGDHPIDIPNEQIRPTIPSTGNDTEEVVENETSETNEQQEEVNQVIQEEEDQQVHKKNFDGYEPLIDAIKQLNWKKAEEYLNDHETVITDIFRRRDSGMEIKTILLRAAYLHQYPFLKKFLTLVPPKALEFAKPNGVTILHTAAAFGDIKLVKALVEKNPNLTQIRADEHGLPLAIAAISYTDGQKEVLDYLCSVTRNEDPSPFSGEQGAKLLFRLLSANMYGTALSVCQRFPGLVERMDVADSDGIRIPNLLRCIVDKPFTFLSGSKLKWWERCIYTVIEVDMDSPYVGGIDREKQKVNVKTSEGTTKEDEENPPDASKGSSLSGQCSSTENNRSITKCISFYSMRYIRRVPFIRRLYDQKLMHKHAVSLTKCFLTQIDKKGIDKERVKDIFVNYKLMENAMKFGTTEFVLESLRVFPWLCSDDREGDIIGHTLKKLVISERNEMIYGFRRILKERFTGHAPSDLDKNNNSILHYCAELPHNRRLNVVSGAAFQMQREIQWFKMVENTMLQKDRYARNDNGDTAQFLFTEKHKELMKEGETWMKDLSTSCMVVAALIATVAFAAAITVPGGNLQDNNSSDNGLPVLLNKKSFMVFVTADALALLSSITSVLMFLAVFTSRYSEEDFLKSLPQKLIIGLATLFISMASILVSFGAAFNIILGQRFHWTSISVSLFSCVPVLLFGFLQFPLFFEMVSSTYWPTFSRKQDHIFEPYFSKAEWLVYLERKKIQRSTTN
ncbi:hypothetical protein MKW98_019794 [Papaver atlanticum]|uniref:PGG domain-containing protein n=1 Tax=Papaver atlanticum TaxID=357466 RepID=A0AAD4TG27_9MAGN|nr:hypothetical protein MKW98_019794 [Papaver atlanticum]